MSWFGSAQHLNLTSPSPRLTGGPAVPIRLYTKSADSRIPDRTEIGGLVSTDSVDRRDSDGVRGIRLFDVVHDVIADVAPEELPLLSGLRQLNDAEIGRQLGRRVRRDDPLGFGVGEVVVLATPIVWGALQQVADRLAVSTVDGLWDRVIAVFRRRSRRKHSSPPQFSHEDLATVRGVVLDTATRSGMKPARAEQLAASVVDRLMFPSTDNT